MSSPEKSIPEKYVTTLRNGKPYTEYTTEYAAHLRHQNRWPDRILSGLVGLAGAAVIGTVIAGASYVLPLVPVAGQAAMAGLSAVASTAGVVAAAGIAALGVVAGIAVAGVAGFLTLAGALRLHEEYTIAMKNDFRPVSALSAGGVVLAAALGMAVTAAPEAPKAAVSKVASLSPVFETARGLKMGAASPAVQMAQAERKTFRVVAAKPVPAADGYA